MDKGLKLSLPRCVHIGPGTVRRLGEEVARLGERALLVTGRRALRESGTLDRVLALMGDAGISVEVFDEVPPEPDLATVDRARERLRGADCDVVIGLGGGSALDAGKAAAALADADEPTAVYHAGADVPARGLPHIAVPTTAGTGSEATSNSVLIDPDGMVKKSLRGPTLLPDVCIVDAELTLSCPPSVTAASGMDALVQAIESYVSVHAVATTEALSL
ncbi:MAG: iron-containing alcohol dehydrogenase, partial [Candidatus Brocadiia bacterium]|nr:iron-containing alcohol dehydrogenase [Candidatus Brocadiia bacterium]